MDAMISGRNGVALVIDDGHLASIHADEPDRLVPRHAGEVPFLIGEGLDFVTVENTSHDEIVRHLSLAKTREEALTLALILMDATISTSLRQEVAEELEDYLNEEDAALFVESVLYSQPLPGEADSQGGLAHARQTGCQRTAALLELVEKQQHEIRSVREAWDAIPSETFHSERERWRFVAVRDGLFRRLALYCAGDRDVNELLLEALKHPVVRSLPNYLGVLRSWVSPFAQDTEGQRADDLYQ